MEFSDVIKDIEKLVGLELNSIRPGANIIIMSVDSERGSLTLQTSSGKVRSRPIEELKKIWTQLMIQPAIHVEGVLHGSGTSRNQPETIFANLPYIEWLKIDNKKHITYVGQPTHAYGTLKQIDPIKVPEIISHIKEAETQTCFKIAVISKDITQSIAEINKIFQGNISTLEEGIYQFETSTDVILIISADLYGIEDGTYCILNTKMKTETRQKIQIAGTTFSVLNYGPIKALVDENK